ncbi:MAG: integrase catalytic domain-containing protein [Dehalococcoidia bacterium]
MEQIKQFLEGSEALEFKALDVEEKYDWIETVLMRFKYYRLKRSKKGVIRRYIQKVTGYSRAQVCSLIREYQQTGELRRPPYRRHRFPKKYTLSDIGLLARTDELHGCLSGPATKRVMEREYEVYGHIEFENISQISIAHLYNLRKSNVYLGTSRQFTKTKPAVPKIGERAKPDPKGQPGHIRVDTIHQGDMNGRKGVYHINAVDEESQWEILASVERISEAYLVPVLDGMLTQFPFVIKGFHSDNGSEFVNKIVAELLNKLLIHFTKSRPRHTNDNSLVETKNGAVVRKNLGYAHIPQACAELLNAYHRDFLNPYINFHRPCFFPVSVIDRRGKIKKTYPYQEVMTPYEKLKSLPQAESCLRPGITFEALETIAKQMSDNKFAERMVKARSTLFNKSQDLPTGLPEATFFELSTYPHSPQRKKKVAKKKERIITATTIIQASLSIRIDSLVPELNP